MHEEGTEATRSTPSTTTSSSARRASIAAAAVLALGGVSACSDSAGPETGAVTAEDLQNIDEELGALEDRVGAFEGSVGDGNSTGTDLLEDADGVFEDSQSLIGQEVTVSAEVSEQYTTTDVGSAFRIAGESGEPISVISASPVAELDANDVVRVTGTVVEVARDTFEEDFGIADDQLFEDVETFYADEEDGVGISADSVEVLQEAAGG